MKRICALVPVALLFAIPAWAQTLPPTPQQLREQHNQAIQNESNNTHNALNQTQEQVQRQRLQQPHIGRSGRAVSHPPGYIPMPR